MLGTTTSTSWGGLLSVLVLLLLLDLPLSSGWYRSRTRRTGYSSSATQITFDSNYYSNVTVLLQSKSLVVVVTSGSSSSNVSLTPQSSSLSSMAISSYAILISNLTSVIADIYYESDLAVSKIDVREVKFNDSVKMFQATIRSYVETSFEPSIASLQPLLINATNSIFLDGDFAWIFGRDQVVISVTNVTILLTPFSAWIKSPTGIAISTIFCVLAVIVVISCIYHFFLRTRHRMFMSSSTSAITVVQQPAVMAVPPQSAQQNNWYPMQQYPPPNYPTQQPPQYYQQPQLQQQQPYYQATATTYKQ